MFSGIIFLLIHFFVITADPNESFSRDIFGFPIPHPPLWTSYVPYLGFFIGIIFEFSSIHGLIGIVASGTLFCVGSFLMGLGEKEKGVGI